MAAAAVVLGGCSMLPWVEEPPLEEAFPTEGREEKPPSKEPEALQRDYSQTKVLKSLVQLHRLVDSFEEFQQYRDGHRSFEAYLETVFLLEYGPYYSGREVTINFYAERGELRHSLIRSVLEETDEGRWWGVRQIRDSGEFYYEVLVGPYGLPRELRYREPADGAVVARRTAADQYVERVLKQRGEEALRRELENRRSREMNSNLPMYYAGMTEERRGTVETPAGRFRGVLFRSSGGPQGGAVWYSPDVMGNVLKILRPDGEVLADIVERNDGRRRRFTTAEKTVVTPPYPPGQP